MENGMKAIKCLYGDKCDLWILRVNIKERLIREGTKVPIEALLSLLTKRNKESDEKPMKSTREPKKGIGGQEC